MPSPVEPVHACATGEARQLRRTTELSPCRKGEWLVSQRPLLVVTDSDNNRVEKFYNDGTFISSWGSFGTAPGQFNFPVGIATDGENNVYVVDRDNERIQVFDASGSFLQQRGWPVLWAGRYRH